MIINRSLHPVTLVVGSVLTVAATASAADAASLLVRVDGANALEVELEEFVSASGSSHFEYSSADSDWSLAFALDAVHDPTDEAWLESALVLTSHDATREFEIVFSVPMCPGIDGATTVEGEVDVRLNADGNGASLFAFGGDALYRGRADSATAAELLTGPFLLTASGASQMHTDSSFGPAPGPSSVGEDFGVRYSFRLSDGDTVELDGAFALHRAADADLVECTPAPDPDLDGDGRVGLNDLLVLIGEWGACPGCAADLDLDDQVAFSDLMIVFNAWE